MREFENLKMKLADLEMREIQHLKMLVFKIIIQIL
jgi:hypothetical protein